MLLLSRAAAVVTLLFLIIPAGCASIPESIKHPVETVTIPSSSQLSRMLDRSLPEAPKQAMSTVLIQNGGWEAFAQRLALIETAQHSIDVQYYIWNGDRSGRFLAKRLFAAAERGVQVRILLDDINLDGREAMLATMDRHPRIDIRIFNPVPGREGFAKWVSVLSDFSRYNRRMHNKSFTVDGVLSIVGGRNIGDEYFDLSDSLNFRDRDVLVSGAVVEDIRESFLQYWNGPWSYPISVLSERISTDMQRLADTVAPEYRNHSPLPIGAEEATEFLSERMSKSRWVSARFVNDPAVPDDADNTSEPKVVARSLAELAKEAERQVLVESAYLIFDDRQLTELKQLASRGIDIKTLTNSMASNDLLTNHSGYAARRRDMLTSGMQLYELKPDAPLCVASTDDPARCAPTAAYGLHAKSVVFDRSIACIGSFNLNLRSTYLNTESLLVIDDAVIAEQLAGEIEEAMMEENSWRLELQEGQLRWVSGAQSWDSDPQTGRWERFKSQLLQLLPIEKYL